MDNYEDFVALVAKYGVGRRGLDDEMFANDEPLPKLIPLEVELYDIINADNIFKNVKPHVCPVPSCQFTSESNLEFENHYNGSHRYSCHVCSKTLPSPRLLDLHIQEKHDSFFAVLSEKKPSYCCYIDECPEKCWSPDERRIHCIETHKLPKDFRFDILSNKSPKKSKQGMPKKKKNENKNVIITNDVIDTQTELKKCDKIFFVNSKGKMFNGSTKKYSNGKSKNHINIDEVMIDLKNNLPVV